MNSTFWKVSKIFPLKCLEYPFSGLSRNALFFIILILIILLQCLIVTHGSIAFHCYKWYDDNTGGAGLHPYQWLICVGFGFGSIIVGFILKFLPEEKCLEVWKKHL
jgi:Ca2+ transporting ATPase